MRPRPAPAAFPRRTFLAAAPALPLALGAAGAEAASAPTPLRVGLVGCGGRGTGAALEALGDGGVRLVALADLFEDQVEETAAMAARAAGERGSVPRGDRHAGPDACRRLLETPLDLVILAAPPATRPGHLAAAVAAGRHVWCETPAAVDGAGLGIFAAALEDAAGAGLVVASGLCARFDPPTADTVARVRAGAIGAVRSIALHHRGNLPWLRPVAPGTDAAARRARNWVLFRDLSGGHLVEHQVHALDRALWILGDDAPLAVEALRPAEAAVPGFGDCPAGVHVRYRFASGAVVEASCRRAPTDAAGVVEAVTGTAGRADLVAATLDGPAGAWRAAEVDAAGRGAMFPAGMADFLRRIRSAGSPGERIEGGLRLLRATALAVAGTTASLAVAGTEAGGSGRPLHFALPRQTPPPSRSV